MQYPKITPIDRKIESDIQNHLNNLTKPVGSLGLLEKIGQKLAIIQQQVKPVLDKKRIYLMAADHGIALEGVSAYPQAVTQQMLLNFLTGGAAINVFSRQAQAELFAINAGVNFDFSTTEFYTHPNFIDRKVDFGTNSFLHRPAMTAEQAEKCLQHGFELAKQAADVGVQIVVLGDMGIGNTTVATAIAAAAGLDLEKIIDIGTVIDEKTLARKKQVIETALEMNQPNPKDGFDILQKVGGFCIGQMTGVILECAARKIPVVLDGFPVTSAGILAQIFEPNVTDYLFAGHQSAVKGHKIMLDHLGLDPILQLGMRLGEGTGGALALLLIEAAVRMMNEMATFESAGVAKGEETA